MAVPSYNAAANSVATLAQVRILSQTTIDAVDHRVDHVLVDLVSDFAGEIRCPIRQTLTRKCGRVLDAEKRRQHGRGENCSESFHLLFLSFVSIKLRLRQRLPYSSLFKEKLRVESGRALVNVHCR
jgi:hypothetical protein